MSQEQAVLNRIWSETLLEELVRFGVEQVCVAPGSRSTPLVLEADANPQLSLHTHFDERGLGFLALGLAKASDKPVAIIVTSGTAVANLLPAIAESGLTGEKLVVLTADRPQELVGCGANQAIVQHGIFSSHVCASLNLPSPTVNVSLNWLLSSVDQVMYEQFNLGGAVHINCPFPEPLYSSTDKSAFSGYVQSLNQWQNNNLPYTRKLYPHASTITTPLELDLDGKPLFSKKGMVVVGNVSLEEAQKAQRLAEKFGWPLLCDPQSGISSDWAHYDLWLQNGSLRAKLEDCEVILQFGSRIISKRLTQWINRQVTNQKCLYVYVSQSSQRNNQDHLMQQHIVANIGLWIDAKMAQCEAMLVPVSGWADSLKAPVKTLQQLAQLHLMGDESLTEIALALDLSERAKPGNVFLGNSLFVRLVDMFSQIEKCQVFTNRGASGIDGLVATAMGTHLMNDTPSLMFIGDTSLLYDLNSLALASNVVQPMVIVVTNNDGGAIFDLLPVPDAQKQSLYQMPHGYQFKYAAKQFNVAYHKAETLADYQSVVSDHLQQGRGALLVEVITPANQASAQLKQFIRQVHAL